MSWRVPIVYFALIFQDNCMHNFTSLYENINDVDILVQMHYARIFSAH